MTDITTGGGLRDTRAPRRTAEAVSNPVRAPLAHYRRAITVLAGEDWRLLARRRGVGFAVALTATLLGAATLPNAASAYGNETFMGNQGLSAGNAYASFSAHTYITGVVKDANHTACPAVASGYGGYTSTPFSGGHNTAYTACGPGFTAWYPNPVGSSLHGAVYNPNVQTYSYIYYANYRWR